MRNTKELKEALKKDFHVLYVKGFTNTWEVERLVRDVEIDVMQLESTERFIEEEKMKSFEEGRKEALEEVKKKFGGGVVIGMEDMTGVARKDLARILKPFIEDYLRESYVECEV